MICRLTTTILLSLTLPGVVQSLDIQEVTSPGGITAWLVEDHSIPFIALEIDFLGGAALEDAAETGTAYFLSGLFDEGAGDYDASAYQRQMRDVAAEFSFDAYRESISVSARFLTEYRDESIELLRLALQEPRFDPDRVDFVRNQILAILADRASAPNDIASDTVNRLAFGDHVLGRPIEGNEESVRIRTRDELEQFRQRALTRNGAYIGVAGDINPEELGILLDELLGGLPLDAPELPPAPDYRLGGGMTVIEFPTPQSTVVFMQEGILRNDEDFLTAYVMNEILGSPSYTSRLQKEVREERGLTYGIASFLGAHSTVGFVTGRFSTENQSVHEAVEVVAEIWRGLANDGVDEAELSRVKTYLIGAYPLRFDGNGSIASILASMQRDDLPITYVENRNTMIDQLTPDDVNRVAARILRPDDLHFVIVGQPEGLDPAATDDSVDISGQPVFGRPEQIHDRPG